MRILIAATALALLPIACVSQFTMSDASLSGAQQTEEMAAITALLDAQDEAWNRGDIPGFMAGYWKSPDLRFASGGTVTRGWQATLDRYVARYGSAETMGHLTTSDNEIVLLSSDAAVVHGRWKLDMEGAEPSGLYTLVLRKVAGQWRIISDTTTSAG
ncbi:MAG: nuclear transport factor 2 family protein [Alphaproteobacteria bacterium]|nr:DUF4440 domain-containing protein [Hyphomonas sp.]MBR9806377.1 nuclear transport factor 2 family protein [Alphaproteobacteria bacterium]